MSIGTWVDQGIVISNATGHSPFVPNVIYEGNAQILSGTVFKMWYSGLSTAHTYYAESTDGLAWTQYASNPVISGQCFTKIFKNGSIYYAFTSTGSFPPTNINVYTSTDGLAWTLQKANALTAGGSGAWDHAVLCQMQVLDIVGGTWYAYYSGSASSTNALQNYPAGLATSTDGVNWTKSASNPVITTGGIQTDFTFQKIGTAYYGWSQVRLADIPGADLAFPSDISRFSATSPTGPWTALGTPTIYRTLTGEGVGITLGQVADPCLVAANGNLYMYYTADVNGTLGSNFTLNCAIATGLTVTQLVQTYEGVQNVPIPDGLSLQLNTLQSDNFTRANANPIGGSWSPLVTGHTAQILSNKVTSSTAGTPGDSYFNAQTWPNDQWSQITLGTIGSTSFAGIYVRMGTSGVQQGYAFVITGGTGSSTGWNLQKFVSGTFTSLSTGTIGPVASGDKLTLAVVGTQLSAYWNGVLVVVQTDSALTSGSAGFEVDALTSTANAAITAWQGGSIVSAPAIPLIVGQSNSVQHFGYGYGFAQL